MMVRNLRLCPGNQVDCIESCTRPLTIVLALSGLLLVGKQSYTGNPLTTVDARFVRLHARRLYAGMRTRMTANGKTVLLVEDNEDNRIVYSTILRHFGYSVSEALNGEEGIAKARAEKPDLILMDISIPVIDGWEATQVLKHDPQTRDIPIIALTAHALASDREKAMEVACDGYP